MSVTKLAGSWSRTLDRLTLQDEDLKYAEEMRRVRPEGLTQALKLGLTELGVNILGKLFHYYYSLFFIRDCVYKYY